MKDRLFTFLSCSVLPCLSLLAQTVSPNIPLHPNSFMQQHEMSIAIHPTNASILLSTALGIDTNASQARIGWYYTTDGGAEWNGRDTLPTHDNLTQPMADETAAIDLNGNLFISGFYGYPGGDFMLNRSTNGGMDWSRTDVPTSDQVDKPHIAVDINAGSPYRDYIYASFTGFNSSAPDPVRFQRSTDGGQTFSAPANISGGIAGSGFAFGTNLAVNGDGVLYASWVGLTSGGILTPGAVPLGFNLSTDGGASWGTAAAIATVNNIGTLTKGGNTIRAWSYPSVAVDRSAGSRRGWIYIVYSERNPTTTDVFLIRSTDGGGNWSSRIKVNQDSGGNDQWQSWMTVDPATGNLYVIYYDSRKFPANDSAEVYVSWSIDGGYTFQDVLVSDVPFLPKAVRHPVLTNYMGSYIGIAALRDSVWTCWNDNRTGFHQAYTSRIVYSPSSGPKGIFSARKVDFGIVSLGSFKDTTIVITNYGDDTLKISNIVSSDPEFTVRPTSMDIPPGKSFTDTIRYTPSFPGTLLATIVVSSNNPSPDTIKVSGGDPVTHVERVSSEIPTAFVLSQNYPNPFNPSTKIGFKLQASGFTTLRIFDLLGREVAMLVNEEMRPGTYEVMWDAARVPSGIYFYRLKVGEFMESKKLMLLR